MPRIAIFSHDSYGLGHLRRSLTIADALVALRRDLDCLVITGSPRALAFKLPERVDAVKIPSITKDRTGAYVSRKLRQDRASILRLRSVLTEHALREYAPDVVLVDHAPTGADNELLPVLERLAQARHAPRLVLGLRDIIDDPMSVERQWRSSDMWRALDLYDEVLVYGDRAVTTTADELGLAARLSVPVSTVGYVAPSMPEASPDQPYLLVTAGGGGDGHGLIRRVLDAIEAGAVNLPVRIVSGPLLSKKRMAELVNRASHLRAVDIIDFTPDLRDWISSAAALVCMAGYNTTVEAVAAGVPTLLVPRSDFRAEQRIRAERISGVVSDIDHVVHLDELGSDRLAELLATAANRPAALRSPAAQPTSTAPASSAAQPTSTAPASSAAQPTSTAPASSAAQPTSTAPASSAGLDLGGACRAAWRLTSPPAADSARSKRTGALATPSRTATPPRTAAALRSAATDSVPHPAAHADLEVAR